MTRSSLLFLLAFGLFCEPCYSQAAKSDFDTGAYMAELQMEIKRNWHPQISGKKKYLSSRIKFEIERDGRPTHVRIDKGSGNSELDQASVLAVLKSSFKPLPPAAPAPLEIEFSFDYKKQAEKKNDELSLDLNRKGRWDGNVFRLYHLILRVAAPLIVAVLLFIQLLMLLVFLLWLGLEHFKLRSGRTLAACAETPGKEAHEYEDADQDS
ncbi:MAG: TonB C-terminal domain-containing protein [Candidatus Obscuribacterales bacterium]|nr:TonB C-terminal domain-containing protein [Candidatus Obscuribacterales bacterium]